MPISQSSVNTHQFAPHFLQSQNVARPTMSSREIAELTGKSHDNVLRDARLLVAGGVLKTEETPYVHPQNGQTYPEFLLDERDSLVLVSGYDATLRAKIIDRWIELEARPAFDYAAALNDPRTLLALLTDNVKKVVALEADNTELSQENLMLEQKVVADAPKVEFFNAVITSTSIHSVREVAQSIGTGQNRLFAFMRQQRWIDRHNTPYQGRVESGHLVAEPHSYKCPETGERKTKFTCKVTGKGFTKLQSLWAGREADLLGGAA